MLSDLSPEKIYLCREAVDFRKSINGLSLLVEELLAQNPLSGHWFVFNKGVIVKSGVQHLPWPA